MDEEETMTASESVFEIAVAVAALIDIPRNCVSDGVYYGKSKRYAVLTTRAEPVFYGDDTPLVDRFSVDFDVYVPLEENYRAWVDLVRTGLEAQDLTEVTYEGQTIDTEAEKRHLMFNGLLDITRG